MIFDLPSVQVMAALVVNVSGILFIVDTVVRRDEGAGRIWALGFLAGMMTALAYAVWAQTPDAWWAVVVGNGAFVAGTGCMWLGCRAFNGRAMTWPSALVAAAVLAAGAAVAVAGPSGGDWAGALWMFVPLAVFAAAGAAECVRGAMRESRTAWVLFAVLALQSVFFAGRSAAFLIIGPEDDLFQTVFGTVNAAMLTVTLTIVALVATSVLRATRAPVRGHLAPASDPGDGIEGLSTRESFAFALADLCARASRRDEPVAVISVRIEDLEQISTAFGSDAGRSVAETWRAAVRRHAPSNALLGEDGPAGVLIGLLVSSAGDARRQASVIYRNLFDELDAAAVEVIPVVGLGVALSEVIGYEPQALIRAARETATVAAVSVESSVLVGEASESRAPLRRP